MGGFSLLGLLQFLPNPFLREMRRFSRRWFLWMKAAIWRGLMAIGMKFHHLADPKPPSPNFKILVPSRLSAAGGQFKLVFYVPESYYTDTDEEYRYPVVVNFHGGGFTLGTGTDDARWASAVLKNVDAIFVSVEYRLAPEFPFSIGVEDGTDALLYLAAHAEELRIDPHRMALSGFSAGGNFAFTVPLMLRDLQNDAGRRSLHDTANTHPLHNYKSSSNLSLPRPTLTRTSSAATSTQSILKLSDLEPLLSKLIRRFQTLLSAPLSPSTLLPTFDRLAPRNDPQIQYQKKTSHPFLQIYSMSPTCLDAISTSQTHTFLLRRRQMPTLQRHILKTLCYIPANTTC